MKYFQRKKRRGPSSEMTRLKALWLTMSAEDRACWQEQFLSSATAAETRQLILERLKINIGYNELLYYFRRWVEDQNARDAQQERMQENETQLVDEHPDWTPDQVRDAVIKAAYCETLATGDYQLGLATVRQDLNVKKWELEREKFEFDAAARCLAALPTLQAIRKNSDLSDLEKLRQVRLQLFAIIPEAKTP